MSVDNVEERSAQLDDVTRRIYEYKALEALTKTLALCQDLSVLVRHELLLALSRLVFSPKAFDKSTTCGKQSGENGQVEVRCSNAQKY